MQPKEKNTTNCGTVTDPLLKKRRSLLKGRQRCKDIQFCFVFKLQNLLAALKQEASAGKTVLSSSGRSSGTTKDKPDKVNGVGGRRDDVSLWFNFTRSCTGRTTFPAPSSLPPFTS